MSIFIDFNNMRHGRACPRHPALARILSIGRQSAFFRTLLELGPTAVDSKLDPCDVGGVIGG